MANVGSIEIGCRLSIDRDTAEACLRIASLYARQINGIIALEKGSDGFEYSFKAVDDANER